MKGWFVGKCGRLSCFVQQNVSTTLCSEGGNGTK